MNTFQTVEKIRDAVAALPFEAHIVALSVSQRARGAIVTVQRARGDFASWEWAEVCPSQLFTGHYDMSEDESEENHAERFARLTGVAL